MLFINKEITVSRFLLTIVRENNNRQVIKEASPAPRGGDSVNHAAERKMSVCREKCKTLHYIDYRIISFSVSL